MSRSSYILFVCLVLSMPPLAQSDQARQRGLLAYRQALKLFNDPNATDRTDSLALVYFAQTTRTLPATATNAAVLYDCYEKTGEIYQTDAQQSPALTAYRQAASLCSRFGLPDSLLFKPYLYAGNAHYLMHAFDSSLYYFERAERILRRHPTLSEAQRLYNSFGALYYEAGNYRLSINYFQKALDLHLRRNKQDPTTLYSFNSNIASALRHLERYDSAAVIYKRLLPLRVGSSKLLLNLGLTYLEKKEPDQALAYLRQVQLPDTDGERIVLYNAFGQALLQKQQLALARQFLLRALAVRLGTASRKNNNVGMTYRLLGNLEMQRRNYPAALRYYQQSIIQLDYDFDNPDIRQNPTQFTRGFSSFLLFESLAAKANCLQQLNTRQPNANHWQTALNTYRAAFRLANYVEKSFDSEDARLFIVGKVFPVYQQAVTLLVWAHQHTKQPTYLEEAFRWSEQSKAAVLFISQKENESKTNTGIPDSLLRQERNLKYNLSRLFLQMSRATDDQEAERLAGAVRDHELALARLTDQLHDYPDYYRKKFGADSIDITTLRRRVLGPRTALLSFFQTNQALFTFVITPDQIHYHQMPVNPAFRQVLNGLVAQLRRVDTDENYDGSLYARYLYDKLIRPVQGPLQGMSALVIIPHNELALLPFDALEDEHGRYLLERMSITYQYAASFLRAEESPAIDLSRTLALAPFTATRPAPVRRGDNGVGATTLSPLPASEQEIASLGGQRLRGPAATKAQFLKLASQASVVHLATHAIADNASPAQSYIAFSPAPNGDDRLYAHEFQYATLSDVQLVFLSACETASGKLVRGEGVMSLSRAISYAGCPNLVTSLWRAEDNATAYISIRFYEHLRQGLSVAGALRQAKLDLLHSEQYAQFHAPPYWSHLVFVGQPPQPPSRSAAWLIAIIVLVTVGIVYWLHRRQRSGSLPVSQRPEA